MPFKPIENMRARVETSKEDSNVAYYCDLLHYGEMLTKLVALFMVSNINDDVDRNRYRFEFKLVRANGVGEYADVLTELVTGNAATSLPSELFPNEVEQLRHKAEKGTWQEESLSALQDVIENLGISANKLTPKSSLLIWFSNFAVLRNKTTGHGSITSEKCGLACVNLEKSIELIYENLHLFQRPWAYLKQNLNGKFRVSFLTDSSPHFDYLKRPNAETLQDGVYCFTDRPHRINLAFSSPELLSFKLVNGAFSDSAKQYEVIDYVEDEKEIVDGSVYMTPPTKLPDSITSGKKSFVVSGESFSNVPLDLPDYIERKELEGELQSVIIDEERFPIITLKGRGGIGKTSLAIHVLDNIYSENRFDIVVWFSSRDVDLFSSGPKQVQSDVMSKKDISKQFFSLISPGTCPPKNSEELFSAELTKSSFGKALYVFDNFETLANPVELYEWLNTYIRLPNKILITSRLNRNFKADYPIEVSGMSDPECRALISRTARKFSIEQVLSEQYITNVIDESGGHPYIIKVILGEAAIQGKPVNVKRVVADKANILDALFKRTYGTLSSAAQRVFLTLCSWQSTVPLLALESIIQRPENEYIDVEKAVEELNKSSFIELLDSSGEDYISVPLVASIFGNKELEVSPDKFKILEDKKLLMEFGAGNVRGVLNIQAHIRRKIKAVAARINSGVELMGELSTLECLASKYSVAWIDIADLLREYKLYEEEKRVCREFIKTCKHDEDKIRIWERIVLLCKFTNDWRGESSSMIELVSIPSVQYCQVSNIASRINQYYCSTNDPYNEDTKSFLIEKVTNVMESRIGEASSIDCSRLSWLFLNCSNESKALKYAIIGLEKDPNNSHCQKIKDKLSV